MNTTPISVNQTLKTLMDKQAQAPTYTDSINTTIEVFDYIITHKDTIITDKYKDRNIIILNKLLELKHKNADVFDADKYIKILFPNHETTNTLIFEDYTQNKFTDKQTYNPNQTTFLNTILTNLNKKYPSFDKNHIISSLNKSTDQIKDDPNYPDGPYLIKINDDMYELHTKETTITITTGYFYSTNTTTTHMKKVGKYGFIY